MTGDLSALIWCVLPFFSVTDVPLLTLMPVQATAFFWTLTVAVAVLPLARVTVTLAVPTFFPAFSLMLVEPDLDAVTIEVLLDLTDLMLSPDLNVTFRAEEDWPTLSVTLEALSLMEEGRFAIAVPSLIMRPQVLQYVSPV